MTKFGQIYSKILIQFLALLILTWYFVFPKVFQVKDLLQILLNN